MRKSLSIFNPTTAKSHNLLSLFMNDSAENSRDKNCCGDITYPSVAACAAQAALTAVGAHVRKDEGDG